MGSVLATVMACTCLPIVLPLMLSSLQQLSRQEVTLTRWSFLGIRVTRMRGMSAIVFSGAQFIAGLLVITGLFNGITSNSLIPLFDSLLLGAVIGIGGGLLARNLSGVEISEQRPRVQWQNLRTQVHRNQDGGFTVVTHSQSTSPNKDDSTPQTLPPGWDDADVEDADFHDVEDE